MPELRWILAAIGLVVVVGVYLYSRHRSQRESFGDADIPSRIEPTLDSDPDWVPDTQQPAVEHPPEPPVVHAEPEAAPEDEPSVPTDEPVSRAPRAAAPRPRADTQTIVSLQLRANPGDVYDGGELFAAFEAQRLKFGRLDAFHRLDADGEAVFTVANLVNPGTFDPAAADDFTTRGVALFMIVPGEGDDVATLDAMIDCARGLADSLGGEVCDESGCTFNAQLESHLREEIVQLKHQARVGTARRGGGVQGQ